MATTNRRAGTIFFKIDGTVRDAKGNFTYNFGSPKRTTIVGADKTHGFKEEPQPASIEGEITDKGDLDVKAITNIEDSTITLELNNGKTVALQNGYYTADGNVQTNEANIQVRFEGPEMNEV